VAVGGDELLYADKKLLIHFHDLSDEKKYQSQISSCKDRYT
jgi:hypothetical protein